MESEDKKPIFTKRSILVVLAIILLILIIFLLLRRCGNGGGDYKVAQINLTPTRINVKVGEQQQVYANVLPSDAKDSSVYWTVTDPSIASVDQNGVITGIKDGVTIVTATANDGSGVTGSATLTVGDDLPELEQIQLDRSTYTVGVGKVVMVEITPVPATASLSDVKYSTTDTSIATVDSSGKIRGVKVGTTILNISANDGKVTTSATVKVVNNSSGNNGNSGNTGSKDEPVTKIDLPATETCYKLKVGSSYTIETKILPTNATNKTLTWEVVSNEDPTNATKNKEAKNYASVSSTGVVKGLKAGKVKIKVTAKSGIYSYFNIEVISSGNEGYCNITSDNTGGNTGGNTGSTTIVAKPIVGFLCGAKEYSGSCSSDVGVSLSNTSNADKTYVCLYVGNGTCDPSTNPTNYPFISSTGTYTYCAVNEKNGKKSDIVCNSKYIVINKGSSNVEPKCEADISPANVKVGADIRVTVTCSSTVAGDRNSSVSIKNNCSGLATVTSTPRVNSSTSFSEVIKITGKSIGSCTITVPEGLGVFQNKKTPARTIGVNVTAAISDTVKKPTVLFMCNGKEYSGSCASNVTAAVNGTKGTDYDKVLYCRASGNAECSPSKAVGPIISSSGEYTYCAAYEKNGKQGATGCTHKNIIIASNLSCSISFDSNTNTLTATVSGGTGTLKAKEDATWSGALNSTNNKFTKKITNSGIYSFTAKDSAGQQATCSKTIKGTTTRSTYSCTTPSWKVSSTTYVKACAVVPAKSTASNYVTCDRTLVIEACESSGLTIPCFKKTEYVRIGCSAYSATAYKVEDNVNSCIKSDTFFDKVTCETKLSAD